MNQKSTFDRKQSMFESLERALLAIPEKPLPKGMLERIHGAIRDEAWLRSARRGAWALVAGLLGLFAVVTITWQALVDELSQSSFIDYLHLFWSDSDVMLAHWQDALYGLLESLPVVNIIVGLLGLFFLLSLMSTILQLRSHAQFKRHALSS